MGGDCLKAPPFWIFRIILRFLTAGEHSAEVLAQFGYGPGEIEEFKNRPSSDRTVVHTDGAPKESMMKKIAALVFMFMLLAAGPLLAVQSTILDVEGKACMGDDKSRKQTEQAAMTDAKRTAAERALTYVKSETQVKDMAVEKDLVNAYSRATVKVVEELDKAWYKDADAGNCYRIKIRAEIVPDEQMLAKAADVKGLADDPGAPLAVKLWTDKSEYKQGETVKIYIKGNKPFHARLLYKDAAGQMLQLLPNPYRSEDYFNGGVIYEIPSTQDRFELEVSPPFGREDIVVYAGTAPLGEIRLKAGKNDPVYQVVSKSDDLPRLTRGIKIKEKTSGGKDLPSEFYEQTLTIKTSR
ncbi:MAG: DUF4384 domain-containing protein [Deltaproteobacteria bacterium]|nr:DUF4384 domain-containing protein [Deltaproteobacteria bacterium]